MTRNQIREIARATKSICHPQGMGNVVNVWPDGSWTEECSANTSIARLGPGDERTYRIACITHPLTASAVAALVAGADECDAETGND